MTAIFMATVMILSALVIALPGMQGREYGMNPAVASSGSIQPNPTLNTNATWSTFHQGWSPLEYSNGTANLSLNAEINTAYNNPIAVSLQDIKSTQLQGTVKGIGAFDNVSAWKPANVANGGDAATGSLSPWQSESNTSGYLKLTTNSSTTSEDGLGAMINIPISDMPSSNGQFDYITMIYGATGQQVTGLYLNNMIQNQTNDGTFIRQPETFTNLGTYYQSISIAQLKQDFTSSATEIQIGIGLELPKVTTASDYTLDLYGLAITTEPLTLGQVSTTNGTLTPTEFNNTALLSSLNPDFSWTSIIDGGYTVSVSQAVQNLTTQQSSINSGSYIEQVEYQGQFELPAAPDLSYGPANLTEHFNVSTSQTQVLDINGVSYLSTISGKNNTVVLLSSVSPNSQTQFLQIVDYTQSQWTSISSPPGIFTLAGIEYYWEEFIIAVLAIVGVGAGAASRHASNLRKVK